MVVRGGVHNIISNNSFFRTLPSQCASMLPCALPNGEVQWLLDTSSGIDLQSGGEGGGQEFWCLCCMLSSPLEMVQTRVSAFDTETCVHVHANSLEMTQTLTSVSNTETCFRVDLLYSLELAHKRTSVSNTETHFRVRHIDSFWCPTKKLVSLTVFLTIHCTLTSSARSQHKLSKASTAVPSPSSAPLLCSQ